MTGSAIGSPMLQARVPLVLDLPEQAWFDVQLMHKDIRLALGAARQSRLQLPAASAADRGRSWAEELGYGQRDIAGFFQVLRRMAAPAHPEARAGGRGRAGARRRTRRRRTGSA